MGSYLLKNPRFEVRKKISNIKIEIVFSNKGKIRKKGKG